MFEEFYGFREKPFQLAPNSDYLYKSEKHRKALTYLEYGMTENVGIIVLTGDVGSGKTTLIQYILKKHGGDFDTAVISNTNITSGQMLRMVQNEFEIPHEDGDKAAVIESLNRYFIQQYERDRRTLLVIDEAQNLSSHALEEVRMLSNLQGEHHSLLQIILIGQPELLRTLKKAEMSQFTQRVAAHFHLTALDFNETVEYIAHRVKKAGGREDLFTPEAVRLIFEISRGVPRSINLICQAALVYGFVDEAKTIGPDLVRQIANDRIGVGIEPDPVDEEAPKHGGRGVQPSDQFENIRMEFKGRVQQLEEDVQRHHDALMEQFKTALDQERSKSDSLGLKITAHNDALALKLTARNDTLALRFATLEKKYMMLNQRLEEVEKKLAKYEEASTDVPEHLLDKAGGLLRSKGRGKK